MSDLQRAIEIAVAAHRGQVRKGGTPYILHPLRLMLAVESDEERIAAVLHDVVEDTEVTLRDLAQEGFSAAVLDALSLLTHDDDQDYMDYIEEIKTNPLARAVKLADLKDNTNVFELPEIRPRDLERFAKYHRAFCLLSSED